MVEHMITYTIPVGSRCDGRAHVRASQHMITYTIPHMAAELWTAHHQL
jgi:hypothetical protein